MSKSEKRQFKIFSSNRIAEKENNYVKLFDAIDRQTKYDEKQLLKEEKYIKQLPLLKNRLYEIILQSLDVLYSTNSVEATLRNYLHYIEILFDKGLYKQCSKIISSAKKIASDHESYPMMIEIFEWERNLIHIEYNETVRENDLINITKEQIVCLDKWKNYTEYRNLNSMVLLMHRKVRHVRNEDIANDLNAIINYDLFKQESSALSDRAKYYFYHAQGLYFFGRGDYENGHAYFTKALRLMEDNPKFTIANLQRYTSILANLIVATTLLKKHNGMLSIIRKLKAIPQMFSTILIPENIKIKIFTVTYINELAIYGNTGEFEKGMLLIPEVQIGLEHFKTKINKRQLSVIYYNISSIYFGVNDYSRALIWINKILNDTEIEKTVPDLYCFSCILNLIIHFELAHFDLLEYIVKSTYRYLYKRGRLYKVEASILSFIRKKPPKIKSNEELIKAFKELKIELKEIYKDPFEKGALEYFDIISWLESKIENKSFAEIVKEKAKLVNNNPV